MVPEGGPVPTYQYACTSCGEQTEAVQRFTDDPLTVCPACGGALRKVFSPVGIVFKGSGFYRTDSRNGSVPAGDKGDKGDKADKGDAKKANGDSAKSDSKPAADTAKKSETKSSQPASAASST